MVEVRWDPERPVPPDDGAMHTHTARGMHVSAAKAGPGNDIADGEWRVLLTLTAGSDIPSGHRVARAMTSDQALELAQALTQAAGDLESGRVAD